MDKPAPPGLIASLGALTRNAFGLVLSRVELAAVELADVRNHVLRLLVVFALAAMAGWFAIAYGTVTVVYLAWAALGWKILLIMTAVFGLIALGLGWYGLAMIRQGKLSLPATMAELKSDRDMLL
jgi:uncharacterized membrane protein YqjE